LRPEGDLYLRESTNHSVNFGKPQAKKRLGLVNWERRGLLHKLANRVVKGQVGFTLIEMIVVVGIIAVLVAVIVPNVARFTGSGEQGARDVELDNVQDAFELMMAENQVVALTPHDKSNSSTATASWDTLPAVGAGVQPLAGYLVNASTVYYYCFDGAGIVLEQFKAAAPCTLP
jgi:type IV pilus assembly protein PilA